MRYSQEFADKVLAASSVGFTITEIARLLRVSVDQFNLWVMVYPAFAAAMRANAQAQTDRVRAALYQRAVGYEITEEKFYFDRENGEAIPYEVVTHIPAEPRAAVEWMKAYEPEVWSPPTGPGSTDGKNIVVEGGLPDPPPAGGTGAAEK